MELGIIGLPNVGKTTLFNVLTKGHAPIGNFPFTTTDQNIGVAILPDKRLDKLNEIYKPKKLTPASLRLVDIAGLVKGASQGLGLGNKFLSYIREVDALIQVIRCFPDDKVVNVLGEVDPREEIDIVNTELLLSDLEQVERMEEKWQPKAKASDKEAKEKISFLEEIKKNLSESIPLRQIKSLPATVQEYHFLTSKPIFYVANLDEKNLTQTPFFWQELKTYVEQKQKAELLGLCVELEAELSELIPEEKEKYRQEFGERENEVEKIIWTAYSLLKLVTFFTVVGTEVRAWTVPEGTLAVKAAGKVHTDMERGFIKAEVFSFADLEKVAPQEPIDNIPKLIHEKGLVYIEGKDYQIREGDIVHFRFHV